MFVSKEAVPVADGPNTIYIRPKMDVGTRNAVIGEAARVQIEEDDTRTNMDVGAYNIALLVHNVLRWEGPAFEGTPCTAENVCRLDPDEPLVEQVLAEIARRNPVRKKEKKGRSAAAG